MRVRYVARDDDGSSRLGNVGFACCAVYVGVLCCTWMYATISDRTRRACVREGLRFYLSMTVPPYTLCPK